MFVDRWPCLQYCVRSARYRQPAGRRQRAVHDSDGDEDAVFGARIVFGRHFRATALWRDRSAGPSGCRTVFGLSHTASFPYSKTTFPSLIVVTTFISAVTSVIGSLSMIRRAMQSSGSKITCMVPLHRRRWPTTGGHWPAMSTHRPYRPGLGIEAALAETERGRGTLYDAEVVDTCLQLFRQQAYVIPA